MRGRADIDPQRLGPGAEVVIDFDATVGGANDSDIVAAFRQNLGQRTNHIGEATDFYEGINFG